MLMGFLDRFRSSGLKWKCQSCGHVHSQNPEKCSNCGHTVLKQWRTSVASPSTSSSSSGRRFQHVDSPGGVDRNEWVCMKCKQSHDNERDECKVCGHEELKLVGQSSDQRSQDDHTDGTADGQTISNIREIQGTQNTGGPRYRYRALLAVGLLLIVGLIVLVLL